MEYASDHGRSWRDHLQGWLETELGWEVFNPVQQSERYFRNRYPGLDFRGLKGTDPERFRLIVAELVDLDCREIAERTDAVICYWDSSAMRGGGTKGEVTIARYFRKPVYLVTSHPVHEIPGWVLGCTTRVFPDFETLRAFLLPQAPSRP